MVTILVIFLTVFIILASIYSANKKETFSSENMIESAKFTEEIIKKKGDECYTNVKKEHLQLEEENDLLKDMENIADKFKYVCGAIKKMKEKSEKSKDLQSQNSDLVDSDEMSIEDPG